MADTAADIADRILREALMWKTAGVNSGVIHLSAEGWHPIWKPEHQGIAAARVVVPMGGEVTADTIQDSLAAQVQAMEDWWDRKERNEYAAMTRRLEREMKEHPERFPKCGDCNAPRPAPHDPCPQCNSEQPADVRGMNPRAAHLIGQGDWK